MKIEVELALVLPSLARVGDGCGSPGPDDPCAERLTTALRNRTGIEQAHVIADETGDGARLCVHYDPAVISLERLRELIRSTGATLTARFAHLSFEIDPERPQARRRIEDSVRRIPGVLEAEASETGFLRIEVDTEKGETAAVLKAVEKLTGGTEKPREGSHEKDDHDHEHGKLETMLEVGSAGLGAILWIGALLIGLLEAGPTLRSVLLYGVYGTTGLFVARDALRSWLSGRLEIDSLMIAAAIGAAILGAWSEGALLLVLFAVGHALERYAMQRARRAIEALGELTPQTAIRIREGGDESVPVAELEIGDRVRVRAHERVPADGVVAKGSGAVNEAPITGESVPADKEAAPDPASLVGGWQEAPRRHRVFAGAINEASALEIIVARAGGDSTIARLVTMVAEAETQKSPTQQLTDRFERIFVPVVLVFAALLFFAWTVVDESFAASAYRALAVLVAASPCALAIATPSAVLSAVARAGQKGVLIKGGGPLEALGRVHAIAFDKTGTLTRGEPSVTDIEVAPGVTEAELARVAIALEATSEHPLARAVTRDLAGRASAAETSEAQAIIGRGLRGVVDGQVAWVGSRKLFDEETAPTIEPAMIAVLEDLQARGRTIVVVGHGPRVLGVLGIMDEPREAAADAIAGLRAIGVETMVMLSGDNQRAAAAIGKAVGVHDARGGLMPEDKVAAIKELRESAGGVAMVGDGVNDAPAMASANIGIAMGAAGSDVALETADIALMSDDLSQLQFAVSLSRKSARIIRQNLLLSLGVVVLLIPATIIGVGIGPAVIAHEGSTLVVVANALRLLRHGR